MRDIFAAVRNKRELGWGPYPDPGSKGVLLVARVTQDVTVDEWEGLFYQHITDGKEFPITRAAHAAVEKWGGEVLTAVSVGEA